MVDTTIANTHARSIGYMLPWTEKKKAYVLNKLRVSTAAAVLAGLLTCGTSLLLDVWDCYVQHVASKGFRDTGVVSLSLSFGVESGKSHRNGNLHCV